MNSVVGREVIWFFIALVVAIPSGILFLYLFPVLPSGERLSQDEEVLEMEFLICGGLLGFLGVYIIRLVVWAVRKVLVPI